MILQGGGSGKRYSISEVKDFYEEIAESRRRTGRHLSESYYYREHWDNEANRIASDVGSMKGRLILDVGCGPARILKHLTSLDEGEYIGLDIARKAISPNTTTLNAGFVLSDAESLPFNSQSFDAVIASHLIEHLYNPEAFLCECSRVLKGGGTLIIATPNRTSFLKQPMLMKAAFLVGAAISFTLSIPKPKIFIIRITDLASGRKPFRNMTSTHSQEEHVHEFSFNELKSATLSHDFEMIDFRFSGLHLFFYSLTLNDLFGRLWRLLSMKTEEWQSPHLTRFALDIKLTAKKK